MCSIYLLGAETPGFFWWLPVTAGLQEARKQIHTFPKMAKWSIKIPTTLRLFSQRPKNVCQCFC